VISSVEDLEGQAPDSFCALLALDQENIVIVLGKTVDLTRFEYDGKSLAFLAKPGCSAVVASRTMLAKSLAELDAYDRRLGRFPPQTDLPQITFTADPEDSED
jgi:hypothetical protein